MAQKKLDMVRLNKLLRLATQNSQQEEARTAAVTVCKELVRGGRFVWDRDPTQYAQYVAQLELQIARLQARGWLARLFNLEA